MKFNVNDYPGDYVMFCDSSDETAEFAEVLNAQGKTLHSGSSYLTTPHHIRAFFFNSGTYSRFADEKTVHRYRPRCRILRWKDFSSETPDFPLKFEDIFGGDIT